MTAPHDDFAQWLGQQVAALTYAADNTANVFVDATPSAPDRMVAVLSQGGPESDSKLPYDEIAVQLVFRCEANPTWALDRWTEVYGLVHGRRNVTLPQGTHMLWAIVVQSSPIRLGQDENGRHQYSMNIRIEIRNPTTERPA